MGQRSRTDFGPKSSRGTGKSGIGFGQESPRDREISDPAGRAALADLSVAVAEVIAPIFGCVHPDARELILAITDEVKVPL